MTPLDPPPGVQAERTSLAWRRTALSAIAGVATIARLRWSELGVLAVLAACVGLLLGLSVLRAERLIGVRGEARPSVAAPRTDVGWAAIGLTALTALIGVTELVALA